MAKELLSVKFVESNKNKAGMYCDGGGLYLRVAEGGSKQWIFRYVGKDPTHPRGYRLRDMGLGPVSDITLPEAREQARQLRNLRREGTDPIAHKIMAKAEREARAMRTKTFRECTEEFIRDNQANWKSAQTAYRPHFEKYVHPVIGSMPVHLIETPHVLAVLKPHWEKIPRRMEVLQGRIENILDWATAHDFRKGDNPARWVGLLEHALPHPDQFAPKKPHAAVPYQQMPEFMSRLRKETSVAAKCLELTILAANRAQEARGALWNEVDLEARTWTIPGERMKEGKAHRIPLSDDAIALLNEMLAIKRNEYVFPSEPRPALSPRNKSGKTTYFVKGASHLGNHATRVVCQQLMPNVTVHGFRSTFRDWAAEETNFPNHVVEMALAHAIPSETERAYRRGDLFQKGAELMEAWARYLSGRDYDEKVVPLKRRA
jgi:integrase